MNQMPEQLPLWFRIFSYRDIEGEARTKRIVRVGWLLALFTVSLLLSVVAAMRYPYAFHLPALAACFFAVATMWVVRWETEFRIVVLYLAATVPVNLWITHMAMDASTVAPMLALAGVILASGLAGLLIVARTKENLSIPVKIAVMALVVGVFAACPVAIGLGQPGDTFEFARLWLSAAFAPMALLVVLTFMVLLAYHRKVVSMPPDRWV